MYKYSQPQALPFSHLMKDIWDNGYIRKNGRSGNLIKCKYINIFRFTNKNDHSIMTVMDIAGCPVLVCSQTVLSSTMVQICFNHGC